MHPSDRMIEELKMRTLFYLPFVPDQIKKLDEQDIQCVPNRLSKLFFTIFLTKLTGFFAFFSFSEVRKKCMHIIPLFVSSCAKMKNTCQLRLLQTLQAFFQRNSKCPRELTFTFHSLTHEHWIQFQAKKSLIPLSLSGSRSFF